MMANDFSLLQYWVPCEIEYKGNRVVGLLQEAESQPYANVVTLFPVLMGVSRELTIRVGFTDRGKIKLLEVGDNKPADAVRKLLKIPHPASQMMIFSTEGFRALVRNWWTDFKLGVFSSPPNYVYQGGTPVDVHITQTLSLNGTPFRVIEQDHPIQYGWFWADSDWNIKGQITVADFADDPVWRLRVQNRECRVTYQKPDWVAPSIPEAAFEVWSVHRAYDGYAVNESPFNVIPPLTGIWTGAEKLEVTWL